MTETEMEKAANVAAQLENDLLLMEDTTFTDPLELGWLGPLSTPTASASAKPTTHASSPAKPAANSAAPCTLVACKQCRRVVLHARFTVHMQNCKARQQLAEQQQQAMLQRAAQRPSTPPVSGNHASKASGGVRKGSHQKQPKPKAKRLLSNLNPAARAAALAAVAAAGAAPGADAAAASPAAFGGVEGGKPPLPRIKLQQQVLAGGPLPYSQAHALHASQQAPAGHAAGPRPVLASGVPIKGRAVQEPQLHGAWQFVEVWPGACKRRRTVHNRWAGLDLVSCCGHTRIQGHYQDFGFIHTRPQVSV